MAARKKVMKERSRPMTKLDKSTIKCIIDEAKRIHSTIQSEKKPEIVFPVRSLSNVKYQKKTGYFQLGRGRKRAT